MMAVVIKCESQTVSSKYLAADTLHASVYVNEMMAAGAAMLCVLTGVTAERDQAESKNEHRIKVMKI